MAAKQANEVEVMDAETGEVFQGKEVAIAAQVASGVMIGGVSYGIKQLVNVPTLKHETNETVVIKPIAAIIETTSMQDKEVIIGGVKQIAQEEVTINVVRIIEMGSGQTMEYVCNAITADSLRTTYPNDSYVGKVFGIKKLGVVAGKRYKEVQILELEAQAA